MGERVAGPCGAGHRRILEMDIAMSAKRHAIVDFGEFVKRQQAAVVEAEQADWAKERDEWLGHLKELYGRIELFLADYIKRGEIKRHYHDIEINEENIDRTAHDR
jgi:hypothetical protein